MAGGRQLAMGFRPAREANNIEKRPAIFATQRPLDRRLGFGSTAKLVKQVR